MAISLDLFLNAIIAGLLLGGFYAAVTVGITMSFGMLDVVNIAHPGFILIGSYAAYILSQHFGIDPIVCVLALSPLFYALGLGIYKIYYAAFESRGQESLRGLAFFFGLLFITEVSLLLVYGVDYRFVQTAYIGPTLEFGFIGIPLRMLIPFLVSAALVIALHVLLRYTFFGRAIMAVAQDRLALQLMGANPTRIKEHAFGISIATAAIAGGCLIIIQPVEPSIGRDYIGRVFAICVLGGMGSVPGTVIAALALGVVESFTATFFGPSWSPAIAFGVLLLTLAWRPSGLLGR